MPEDNIGVEKRETLSPKETKAPMQAPVQQRQVQQVAQKREFALPTVRTLIEVRPIERAKWHGKTGAESFQRPKKFQVLVDTDSMSYATGLTEEEIVALNKKVNYDLSSNFNSEEPHPFWDSPMAMYKMENHTMFFDISQPLNYIKIKNMRASKFIANSVADYEEGLYPEATHVIFDESVQAELKASKIEKHTEAIIRSSTMSKDKKIQVILALSHKNMKGQSDNFVNVELRKVIDNETDEFLRYTSMRPEELASYSLVLEALQKSVLRKDGHKILYHDSILGMDEVDVARYLMIEDNQELVIRIKSQVNN